MKTQELTTERVDRNTSLINHSYKNLDTFKVICTVLENKEFIQFHEDYSGLTQIEKFNSFILDIFNSNKILTFEAYEIDQGDSPISKRTFDLKKWIYTGNYSYTEKASEVMAREYSLDFQEYQNFRTDLDFQTSKNPFNSTGNYSVEDNNSEVIELAKIEMQKQGKTKDQIKERL